MKWKFWEKNDGLGGLSGSDNPFGNNQNPVNDQPSNSLSDPLGTTPPPLHPNDSLDTLTKPSPFSTDIQPSNQPDTINQQFAQSASSNSLEKDITILNAKLDTIKAILESVNQRIIKIERIAEGEVSKADNKTKQPTEYRW